MIGFTDFTECNVIQITLFYLIYRKRRMYIGRFAPSPTGLLHIGSLLTAVASYADARTHGGRWLVRMEDLDPPREIAGAAANIVHTLEAFGFEWDDGIVCQSQRHDLYREALGYLKSHDLVYPCYCSRREVQANGHAGVDGVVYNRHCANLPLERAAPNTKIPAWRVRVPDTEVMFEDGIVGQYNQHLARDIGDFVLLRADSYWAYQLAVVVDDAKQGVTHIVRGQDLLISTPRQIYLQRCLGYAEPHYAHLPLLVNKHGQKWSKQTLAPPLDVQKAEPLLRQVLGYLNIPPAPEVDKPRDLLAWAVKHWQMARVPKQAVCTELIPK